MNSKYSMNEEIKMHVYLWLADNRIKNVNPNIKNRLIEIANDIKVSEALIKYGGSSDGEGDEDPLKNERKIFIVMFKEKFLEYTDFKYEEVISPINGNQIGRVCKRLLEEGSSAREYLEWFYDDFARIEANKRFMPPTISFVVQTWIVDKFIFAFKDSLKRRKKDTNESKIKNVIMTIAAAHLENYPDRIVGEKILDFSRDKISLSRFYDQFRKLVQKTDDQETIKKLDELFQKNK